MNTVTKDTTAGAPLLKAAASLAPRQLFRRFRHDPAFSVIFILTIALGVGANAALFSALQGYFLAPLPYKRPARLVVVSQALNGHKGRISDATYKYLNSSAHSINEGGLSRQKTGVVKIRGGNAHTIRTDAVTASLFRTLGTAPFIGRTFSRKADQPDGPHEVILGYRYWKRAFHGDRNAIGQFIELDSVKYKVIGVMPHKFYFPTRRVQLWMPLRLTASDIASRNAFNMAGQRFVARLSSGISLRSTRRNLNAVAHRQLSSVSADDRDYVVHHGYHINTISLRRSLMGSVGTRLLMIELGAGLLLVLTAAILANLVTVRTLARAHDAAIRAALGANRFALWQVAAAETIPLGFIAGAMAASFGWFGTILIRHYGIGTIGTAFSVAPDVWVIVTSVLLGVLVGAVAALPPALMSQERLLSYLGEGGRGGFSARTRWFQRGFAIAQIALCVMLILNAALLTVSFERVSSRNTGLNSSGLSVGDIDLHGPRFQEESARQTFYHRLGTTIRNLNGIDSAGVASALPFSGSINVYSVNGEGKANGGRFGTDAVVEFVGGHALRTIGVKLIAGRLIKPQDVRSGAPVAVVDAALARDMFGTTTVLGRSIRLKKDYRIVGVISSILWKANAESNPPGVMWMPYPSGFSKGNAFSSPTSVNIAIRSDLPQQLLRRELTGALHRIAPSQAFTYISTFRARKDQAYRNDQSLPLLFSIFGLLALLLATIGTYGTVAYLTQKRMVEFAVRQALGATPDDIFRETLKQGTLLAAIGIATGLGGGLLLSRILLHVTKVAGGERMLYAVLVAMVMIVAVLISSALPARRARKASIVSLLRP